MDRPEEEEEVTPSEEEVALGAGRSKWSGMRGGKTGGWGKGAYAFL